MISECPDPVRGNIQGCLQFVMFGKVELVFTECQLGPSSLSSVRGEQQALLPHTSGTRAPIESRETVGAVQPPVPPLSDEEPPNTPTRQRMRLLPPRTELQAQTPPLQVRPQKCGFAAPDLWPHPKASPSDSITSGGESLWRQRLLARRASLWRTCHS